MSTETLNPGEAGFMTQAQRRHEAARGAAVSTEMHEFLTARRDRLIRDASESLTKAEEYYALKSDRGEKDARIRIDWASDALAEASRIDRMIGLL